METPPPPLRRNNRTRNLISAAIMVVLAVAIYLRPSHGVVLPIAGPNAGPNAGTDIIDILIYAYAFFRLAWAIRSFSEPQ